MTTFTFDPHITLNEIVLVGAGGTGGHLARHLARALYDMKSRRLHVPHLTIVDPDIISESNIGRQAFNPTEIGLKKSAVLAARFNLVFGLNITAVTAPFDASRDMHSSYDTLVIGAVDNAAARKSIAQVANALCMDLGNHRISGQLAIGNSTNTSKGSYTPDKQGFYRYLPNPYLVFPELLEDDPPAAANTGLSCAQLVERSQQHLFINDLMSTAASAYIYKLLNRQPLDTWISFVGLDNPTMHSIPVTPESVAYYSKRQAEAA